MVAWKQGFFKQVQLYISMIVKVILHIYNIAINKNFMSNRHFKLALKNNSHH